MLVATAPPKVAAPTAKSIDVALRADSSLSGHPVKPDTAYASATTRFALDAPVGAELRVRVADGVGMNGFAWANDGREGVSFARQGADWVTTTDTPIHQISLKTSAFPERTKEILSDGRQVTIGDIAPKLSVDGVPQDSAAPSVVVQAPLGWKSTAADGTPDALRTVDGVRDAVVADRDATLGSSTRAVFDGRAPDGSRTTGPVRVVREAASRTADAAITSAYIAMQLLGVAP